jgi:hypothetical protein
VSQATQVFGLLDMLRAYGKGELPVEIKLPDDKREPVFIVHDDYQRDILHSVLDIHKRLHAGEIGPWYAKHYCNVASDEHINELAKDPNATRLLRQYSAESLKGHPVVMLFENSRLLRLLTENGISTTQTLDMPESLEEVRKLAATMTVDVLALVKDMDEVVLDGRLGEIYEQRMRNKYCLAFGWPALVTLAGALVPVENRTRVNLYCALVGSPNSGKSTTIEFAKHVLGLGAPTVLDAGKVGSGEGLASSIGDVGNERRVLLPDELAHLLKKANIEGSVLDDVLNGAFYNNKQGLVIARQKQIGFSCQLSVIGGMLEDKFGELFGAAGGTGLYDRFMFGQQPTGYELLYRPFENEPAEEVTASTVEVDPDVWEAKDEWIKKFGFNPRVCEIAVRVATICAAFDGRPRLQSKQLAPALALVRYQHQVRMTLKPNEGETIDAQLAQSFLGYLHRKGGDDWIATRKLFLGTRAYEKSLPVAHRVLDALERSGDIEKTKTASGRGELVRLRLQGNA